MGKNSLGRPQGTYASDAHVSINIPQCGGEKAAKNPGEKGDNMVREIAYHLSKRRFSLTLALLKIRAGRARASSPLDCVSLSLSLSLFFLGIRYNASSPRVSRPHVLYIFWNGGTNETRDASRDSY